MITQAKNIHLKAIQGYELQAIVGFDSPVPRWFEVLYRPEGLDQAEHFFEQMTDQEKINFDIELFALLPSIQNKHQGINLSINLSPLSLCSSRFLDRLDQLLSYQAIDCRRLCIEIVETDVLQPLSKSAIDLLQHFKQLGGQVALDDFGTGHAHWELLQLNLIDVIKVASQNINNKIDNKIFSAMTSFAKQMNLDCVMEGVENETELNFAKKVGFDYCQGWVFNSWKQSV